MFRRRRNRPRSMRKIQVLPRRPGGANGEPMPAPTVILEPEEQLSIIVLAPNESAHIVPTLLTLQPLRTAGHEVIVVDGGGREDTAGLAAELADQVIEGPYGGAAGMNLGARHAWGGTLLFLHAGCLLPDHADKLILSALADKKHQWGGFHVAFPGSHPLLRGVAHIVSWRSRLAGTVAVEQGLFVRRTLYERIGGFSAGLPWRKAVICRRLREAGRPLFLRQPVVSPAHSLPGERCRLWLRRFLSRVRCCKPMEQEACRANGR